MLAGIDALCQFNDFVTDPDGFVIVPVRPELIGFLFQFFYFGDPLYQFLPDEY